MLTLAIDTASNRGVVGLVRDDALLAEHRWDLASTYSLELLSSIDALLVESAIARADIEAIAVCVGPGGYGGLRAGVATAQGLALGLGVPLAGVGRLELDALPYLTGASPVVAVHNAGSAGIAWACYEGGGAQDAPPRELQSPRLGTPVECATAAPTGARFCGELTDELRDALGARGWTEASITATIARDRARSLDMVRLARAHRAFGDPASVDVRYLRPPSITPPREATSRG
ncbi:MAG: tRNA (adenosine(37)-N6)-threonylcarbamoyltransferase complex dimerization subunit type 1 TsaB [Dehalococcoidia bacterium]